MKGYHVQTTFQHKNAVMTEDRESVNWCSFHQLDIWDQKQIYWLPIEYDTIGRNLMVYKCAWLKRNSTGWVAHENHIPTKDQLLLSYTHIVYSYSDIRRYNLRQINYFLWFYKHFFVHYTINKEIHCKLCLQLLLPFASP